MSLGSLVTAAQAGTKNLVLFVIQNDTFEITGNHLFRAPAQSISRLLPGGPEFDARTSSMMQLDTPRNRPSCLAVKGRFLSRAG